MDEARKLIKLGLSLDGLVVYRSIGSDPIVGALKEVLLGLNNPDKTFQDRYKDYHEFCHLALEKNWPRYMLELILEDDNHFSRTAHLQGFQGVEQSLIPLIRRELVLLVQLSRLSPEDLIEAIKETEQKEVSLDWGFWNESTKTMNLWLERERLAVGEGLIHAGSDSEWNYCIKILADYYYKVGYGLGGKYLAFRWQPGYGKKGLKGIEQPDLADETHLVGLEKELNAIWENTENFLAGHAAHNVLLYGSRGTGKSSAVKSLLTKYSDKGVRMVELGKTDLEDFQSIIEELANYRQKFIIFIDDLSFEDMETGYKGLKASLEGRLSARPANVLIYATSNRRHLIRENFAERQGEDVHVQDSMNEKLSLVDRFGLTITFPTTDQSRYLNIVVGLARKKGILIEENQLRQLALRWELMHNGRSGRTAKQLVDHLAAGQYNELK